MVVCQEKSKSSQPTETNPSKQWVPRLKISGAIKDSPKNIDDLHNLKWRERERNKKSTGQSFNVKS